MPRHKERITRLVEYDEERTMYVPRSQDNRYWRTDVSSSIPLRCDSSKSITTLRSLPANVVPGHHRVPVHLRAPATLQILLYPRYSFGLSVCCGQACLENNFSDNGRLSGSWLSYSRLKVYGSRLTVNHG